MFRKYFESGKPNLMSFQRCFHCSCQISDSHLSAHPGLPHPADDQRADAGHLHEGGAVAAGQEAARHGEAAQGEDDPQRDAAQGG